jgi:sugar-specific transcriptional regulator TrmB
MESGFEENLEIPIPPVTMTTNESIDKMTLELLMNKTQYQKYVSKTNPKRFSEMEKYHNSIVMHKHQIMNLTEIFLNEPDKQITNDVNEAFEYYAKTLIQYFQMKLLEEEEEYTDYSDTLFVGMDDDKEKGQVEARNGVRPTTTSFWSKERVVRSDASAFFNRKNLPNNNKK